MLVGLCGGLYARPPTSVRRLAGCAAARRVPGVAGKVGNWSLRTDARWAIIISMAPLPEPRRVAILVYPGVQSLDVTGPLEVFTGRRHARSPSGVPDDDRPPVPAATRSRSSAGDGPTSTSSGLAIVPELRLEDVPGPLDTLDRPGGSGHRRAAAGRGARGMDREHRRPRHAHGVGVHGRLPAGRAPACSTAAARPPTGPPPRSSPTPTPRSTWTPTRSTSATARSGPRPA